MNNKEDDSQEKDDSFFARAITIVFVFIIFILLGCLVCMAHSYSNRSRIDLCHVTEVEEYKDDKGVTITKTSMYFLPKNERPLSL